MGVYARPLKNGKNSWWVTFMADGKQVHERAGTDKRAAERLERQRKSEVRAGTYSREHRTGAVSFEAFAETWGAARRNRTANDDRQRLRDHITPFFRGKRLQDVTRRDTRRLAEELKGKFQSPNTRRNVWGTLSTLFRDAELAELVPANPCVVPRSFFGRQRSAATKRRPYTDDEVVTLTTDGRIDEYRRVWHALAFYTGMRLGEVCGRRFRDWDRARQPLGSLLVATQYHDKPLKTDDSAGEHTRTVPVHPELAQILADWWEHGFELFVGRKPTQNDWIVPQCFDHSKTGTKDGSYNAFQRACAKVGVEAHTVHATRHTFISSARNGGARKDVLEIVTHNAAGTVIDGYTHFDWATLCESVSCVDYKRHRHPAPAAEEVTSTALYDAEYDASPKNGVSLREMGGGAGYRIASASVCNH